MSIEVEHLARRLDEEPAVFKGCTSSELMVILIAAAVVWLPLVSIIAIAMGFFAAGLGLAVVLIVGTMTVVPKWLVAFKRGRPDGYLQHQLVIGLHRRGFRQCPFVIRDGVWETGRTRL